MKDGRESKQQFSQAAGRAKTYDLAQLQRMYRNLLAGRIEGYKRAAHMADAILWRLKKLKKPLSALDATHQQSSAETETLLRETVRKLTISEVRRDFVRLQAGDTDGYASARAMAENIRWRLGRVGARLSHLDPAGVLFDEDIDRAIRRAGHDLTLQAARQTLARLQAGNTDGYASARAMADDLRRDLRAAGVPLSRLDPTGRKSHDAVDWHLKKTVRALTVREGRAILARLRDGEIHGDKALRRTARDLFCRMSATGARLADLDPEGRASEEEIRREIRAFTAKSAPTRALRVRSILQP